jgi:hypothetical protein
MATQTIPAAYGSSAVATWDITTNTTHISGSAAEIQATRLWKYVGEVGFWPRFMGAEGSGSIIVSKRELTKEKGDIVHFYMATPDDDAPISNILEMWGSEEETTLYQEDVIIGLVRHAKKIDKPLSIQRTKLDIQNYLYEAQTQWWVDQGPDKMITNILTGSDYVDGASTAIGSSADANSRVMYGGDATDTDNIDASDILTPDLVWKLSEGARLGKIGSAAVTRKIRPVSTSGGPTYVLVLHPYKHRALQQQCCN